MNTFIIRVKTLNIFTEIIHPKSLPNKCKCFHINDRKIAEIM